MATGGMSPEGTTTIVKTAQPKVSNSDRYVLCPAICKCKDTPGTSADGRSLKQACVSKALKSLDRTMDHKSWYKAEVNYDMTLHPPAPIMDSEVDTKGHDWLPGWIRKYWEDDHGSPYLKGVGMVRRPDVVIVKDPTKPPTQDNIEQVVEIKFPPDDWNKRQKEAYGIIAGGEDKLAKLEPDDCNCDRPDSGQASSIPAADPKTVSAASMLLMLLLGILAF